MKTNIKLSFGDVNIDLMHIINIYHKYSIIHVHMKHIFEINSYIQINPQHLDIFHLAPCRSLDKCVFVSLLKYDIVCHSAGVLQKQMLKERGWQWWWKNLPHQKNFYNARPIYIQPTFCVLTQPHATSVTTVTLDYFWCINATKSNSHNSTSVFVKTGFKLVKLAHFSSEDT